MSYSADSFSAGEQPTTAKWNKLWANDASFNDGSGFATYAIGSSNASLAAGIVCQVVRTDFSADTAGSTILPTDNTIPQITEGFEVMTQAITPKTTGNMLHVEAVVLLGASTGLRNLAAALFQDATAAAVAATTTFQTQSGGDTVLSLGVKIAAASTASTTFRVRIGSDNGGTTVTFGNSRFDTTPHSYIKVTEVKV